jgi:hypothetical protein
LPVVCYIILTAADGVRKSRRFSTGLQKMPPKHRSAPLLSIADEQKPGAERYAELKNQSMQVMITKILHCIAYKIKTNIFFLYWQELKVLKNYHKELYTICYFLLQIFKKYL